MPRYCVRDGERLALNGAVLEAGAVVELARTLASDPAIAGLVQEIDADGHAIGSPAPDDLERFRAHERVSILRERRAVAQAALDAIDARLQAEEDALSAAVAAAHQASSATSSTTSAAPVAPVKE